jgi:hypothetical protein
MADVLAMAVNGLIPVSFGTRHHNDGHFIAILRNRANDAQSRRIAVAYDDNLLSHSYYIPNRLTRPFPGTILYRVFSLNLDKWNLNLIYHEG